MAADLWIPTPRGKLFAGRWQPTTTPATSRPPIILLHDSLGCITLWRDFPEKLAETTGREVIAYDRLGFGQSDPHPDLLTPPDFIRTEAEVDFAAVIQHLGINKFAVLGHSVGGGMGIGVAATMPISCKSLISISAQTFPEDTTIEGVRAAKESYSDPSQIERLKKYHGDKAKWVLDAWIESWLSPAFDNWTLGPLIGAIICPILAIHGSEDEFGSVAHAERIKQSAFTPVTLKILDGEGHVPHRTSTDIVMSAISEFLDSE